MQRPHLCILANQYEHVLSGVGIYAQYLVTRLAAAGWRLTLVVPEGAEPKHLPECVSLRTIPSSGLTSGARWMTLARHFAAGVALLLVRDPPDAIICTDARECRFLPSAGVPIIGVIHDNYAASVPANPLAYLGIYRDWLLRWGYYQVLRRQERIAYQKLTIAICNTDFVAESVRRVFGLQTNKIRVIHCGLDPEMLALDDPPAREPYLILTVGGNSSRKGVPRLIDVLPEVVAAVPDAHLEIVGASDAADQLRRRAVRCGVGGSVKVHGLLSHEAVIRAHHRAAVYAMPAEIEAFGLVYLEAALCGVPVIATANGGAREVFSEPESALLVSPGDQRALRDGLIRLLSDNEYAQRMASRGKRAAEALTVDRMLAHTELVIEDVIQRAHDAKRE